MTYFIINKIDVKILPKHKSCLEITFKLNIFIRE